MLYGASQEIFARLHHSHSHYRFKSPLAKILILIGFLIAVAAPKVIKTLGDTDKEKIAPRVICICIGAALFFAALIADMLYKGQAFNAVSRRLNIQFLFTEVNTNGSKDKTQKNGR